MADSPAVILFDVNGNPVGTIIDGIYYRLQVEAKLTAGEEIIGKVGIDGYETGGLALESTLSEKLNETTFTSRINTLGQKSMSNSTPVVIASNQSPIDVVVVSGDAGNSNLKIAYDIGDTVIYIGEAELGSATASAVWTIKRITLVDGEPTFTEWSDGTAIWDDRTTEIYT